MKKRKMILIKRLALFNNPNKHQLTPNLQSNFLSPGMGMDCISESIEMIFNQLLLLWLHYVLFQAKSNKFLQWILLKQLDKNETWNIYSLFVDCLLKIIDVANCVPRGIFFLNSPSHTAKKCAGNEDVMYQQKRQLPCHKKMCRKQIFFRQKQENISQLSSRKWIKQTHQ